MAGEGNEARSSGRLLGWAAIAVMLLVWAGGLSPTAADAAPTFKAGAYPATIHGSAAKGTQLITTEGGKVECPVSYHAVLEAASTTLALAPTYDTSTNECQVFGFVEATINPEGCAYLLHVTEQTAEDKYKATFEISCPAGKSIKITASNCKVEIKAQSGLDSVALLNDKEATPKRDITFDPEVAGLAYTVTQDGFLCPFKGTGNKTDGSITASSGTTLTGQSPGSPETKIKLEVGEPTSSPSFQAGLYPTTVHGSGATEKFTLDGESIECTGSYHGEVKEASTTLALAPTYSSCKGFGFLEATINPEGCAYLLHVSEQIAEDEYKANLDVSCETGKAMTIVAGPCKAEITAQAGLKAIALTDDTAATPKRDITFAPEVAGLAYTVTQDGFLCPFKGIGEKADGTFTGSATTLTGQSPGNPETKTGIEVG